jgi:transposase
MLALKLQAVKLADHPNVTAKDIAEALGIHVVMLYRWRMEKKNGELRENRHMKAVRASPKRLKQRTDPAKSKDDELIKANRRIKELEKALALRQEELTLLKKAQRFFEKRRR